MADTLEIVIAARDQFSATANKIVGSLGRMESAASRVGRVASTAMVGGLTLASTAIILNARAGVAALEQLEDANAQTAAAIESTGMAAGLTAGDIRRMSESFEDMNALFDDKVVQAGANVLLTFTNIRKEAFEPTMQAALDLSVRMKQDLGTSVLQLGKALNDPVKGLTALRRVGVQFTDQQEEQIKALVRDNDLLGAQRVILDELNKEFGGSFLAQGQTSRAKLAKFGDAVEELQMTLAEGLLPAVVNVADALKSALGDPQVKADIRALGEAIGSVLTPANVQSLVSAAGTVAGLVKSAVSLFNTLPPDLQKLALAAFAVNKITGGAITSLAGLALSSLRTITAGNVTVIGGNVTSGAAGAAGAAGGVSSAIGKVLLIGEAIALLGVVAATNQQIADNTRQQAKDVADTNAKWLAQNPDKASLQSGLAATRSGIKDLEMGPGAILTVLNVAGRNDALNTLKLMEADQQRQLTNAYQQEQLLREQNGSTAELSEALRNMPAPQVTVINNVSGREITNVVKSSSSYGTTSSSYYGGSPAPALSH